MTPETQYWASLISIMFGCFGLGFATASLLISRRARQMITDRNIHRAEFNSSYSSGCQLVGRKTDVLESEVIGD